MAVSTEKYVYETNDKRVRIILADVDEYGAVRVSGDVASRSRPGLYHHVELYISGSCIRFSCSCEAGSFGFLCEHVKDLYNVYRKNWAKILQR